MTIKNKFKLIIATIIFVISIYIGCIYLYPGSVRTLMLSPYIFKEEISKDVISLEIEEESISSEGLSFSLKNHTKQLLGETGYVLEHKMLGTWFVIKPKVLFKVYLYSSSVRNIYANEEENVDIDWSYDMGSLPKGKYRIVKDIYSFPTSETPKYVYAEFEIK